MTDIMAQSGEPSPIIYSAEQLDQVLDDVRAGSRHMTAEQRLRLSQLAKQLIVRRCI